VSRDWRQRTRSGLASAQPADASHDEIAPVAAPVLRRLIDRSTTASLRDVSDTDTNHQSTSKQ
jgi:hypothetical protein